MCMYIYICKYIYVHNYIDGEAIGGGASARPMFAEHSGSFVKSPWGPGVGGRKQIPHQMCA